MTAATAQTGSVTIEDIVAGLQAAWNRASGEGFAQYFAEDADFVNIYGMHAKGRAAIAAGHDNIFCTVYAGSVLSIAIESLRLLRDDVALVHLRSRLQVPTGLLAGEMNALPSMVLTREGAEWRIASFHNVLIQLAPSFPNNRQHR